MVLALGDWETATLHDVYSNERVTDHLDELRGLFAFLDTPYVVLVLESFHNAKRPIRFHCDE